MDLLQEVDVYTMIKKRLNKNRYLYKVYLEAKDTRGIKRIFRLLSAAFRILPRHIFNMTTYIKDIKNDGYIVRLNGYKEVRMYVPLFCEDGIQRIIANSETFFEEDILEDLSRFISADTVVMDVGANIGNHSVFFGRVCGAKKVYAFEPIKNTFDILKKNIEINDLTENVELFNCALGRERGRATIGHYDRSNIGGTTVIEDINGGISVKSIDELEIPNKVDFVKIDVEGFEFNVLEGGKKRLERDKPIIFIEVWDENKDRVNLLLDKLGYRLQKKYGSSNYLYVSYSERL